jgi:hypothetical protein
MIEQLLLHRSGVADPSYSEIATSRVSLSDLVGRIASKPLLFEPGTNGGYSNAGYVLLAAVVERASGMSDADFVRRNIGERLGLHGTFPDLQDEIVPNRAMGYVPGPPPNAIRNVAWYDMSPLIGSGSLVSNVRDLYRWAQAVHREELSRRTTLRYPYGWGVRKYYDRDLIEQSGTIDGFTSYLGVYFRDSTYVVCLTDIEASLNEQCGKDLAWRSACTSHPRHRFLNRPASPSPVRRIPDGIGRRALDRFEFPRPMGTRSSAGRRHEHRITPSRSRRTVIRAGDVYRNAQVRQGVRYDPHPGGSVSREAMESCSRLSSRDECSVLADGDWGRRSGHTGSE